VLPAAVAGVSLHVDMTAYVFYLFWCRQQVSGAEFSQWHNCLTHRTINIEIVGPTVEGIMLKQIIFVSTYLQMSLGLFLNLIYHTLSSGSAANIY